MHPNPAFRKPDAARNLAFARDLGFGVLSVNGAEGPLLAHVPFTLSDNETQVELHLVRSNPIARALREPQPAVIAVQGPYSYISPDWYEVDDQVPTWNYVAVHLRGQLTLRPADELEGMLDRLSALFEQRLAPKRPWRHTKMTPGVMDKMLRAIVPCRLEIAQIDGTWKLNQNKDEAVRLRAADQITAAGQGTDLDMLAALMRDPPA